MRDLCLLLLVFTGTALAEPATSDLVELIRVDPRLQLDIHYARSDNFLGFPVYDEARAFLQRPAAQALKAAHDDLRKQGYGLAIFDGYRPWRVTKLMWDRTPPEKHAYVADPKKGSRHNRGCAVDLTMVDLKTGKQVAMPSEYDDFSRRAHADYEGGTHQQRLHRAILKKAMEAHGFKNLPEEWWHFDFLGWEKYPIQDKSFQELTKP